MATARNLLHTRWTRTIQRPDTLADDLGLIGTWVGPRTGPDKRSQGDKEDYVLRRILAAYKQTHRVSFPLNVQAEIGRPNKPDFVFVSASGETLGLEVTEAGEEEYQRWLTGTEVLDEDPRAELVPQEPSTERTVAELVRAIRRKVDRYRAGAYQDGFACDLVVYDNTAWGGFLDKRDLVRGVRVQNDLDGHFREVHLVLGERVILDVFRKAEVVDVSRAYEVDYTQWIFDQIQKLRGSDTSALDLKNIAGELEDLGKSERRALASHMRNLLLHLLKWEFQPSRRSHGWRASIDNARAELYELLMESPSLRRELPGQLKSQYERARRTAAIETELPLESFPDQCPYEIKQMLDPVHLPGTPS